MAICFQPTYALDLHLDSQAPLVRCFCLLPRRSLLPLNLLHPFYLVKHMFEDWLASLVVASYDTIFYAVFPNPKGRPADITTLEKLWSLCRYTSSRPRTQVSHDLEHNKIENIVYDFRFASYKVREILNLPYGNLTISC